MEGFQFVRVAVPRYTHAHDKRRVLNWILFAWRVARLDRVIKDRPDAILCSSPSLFAILGAEWLARKFGARLVFEVRDIWPLTLIDVGRKSPRHPLIRLMQWVEDRAYRTADRVVSNLPGAADHMVSRGMDRRKFSWIPNGFSRRDIDRPESAQEDILLQIPKNKFVVGYAGTIGVANSLETLIGAADLLRNHDEISFVLLGHGREKASLVASATEKSLSNVHFLPPVSHAQVQSVLSHFDVCCIGLRADGLFRFGVSPNKLFDYLIAGKPIIYGIDSGSYRPVEEFQAGLQVPPQDPAALADAILQLRALSPEERSEMGRNGRRAALERHEYRVLTRRLEDVLLGSA